jgi:hypothetical protein
MQLTRHWRSAPAITAGRRPTATRTAVAVFGVLIGLAGMEHGLGAALQGPVRPDGMVIQSWPDVAAVEPLAGEPAMTVVPNLLVTGILAMGVGLAIAVWSIWFAGRRHGGPVLIGLSALLLLVGGGFGPPLMGVVVGLAATRTDGVARRAPTRLAQGLGRGWAGLVGIAVVGYLALMPGTVLLSALLDVDSAAFVSALMAIAFAAFALALIAARAHDRSGSYQSLHQITDSAP